jgi:hypothetical protein
VADASLVAARALRVLLLGAVLLLAPSLVLVPTPMVRGLQIAGLWTLAAGPFIVLIVVSAGESRTRWFAAATIALVVVGFALAL